MTKEWNFRVLSLQGVLGSGKSGLVEAVCAELNIEIFKTDEWTDKKTF